MSNHCFFKSIILLSAFIFLLVGCGRKGEEKYPVLSETATKTYTINSRMLEFGTEETIMNRNFQIKENTLYF